MENKNKLMPHHINKLFPVLILVAVIFMGVGHASVNSVIIGISGEAIAKEHDEVFITDVVYKSSINADTTSSTITSWHNTNMYSYINLTNNPNSEITYTVTIYNESDEIYYFDKVTFLETEDGTTYSNSNITYKINGLQKGDALLGKNSVSFDITFSYLDINNITDTDLTSILNYKFISASDVISVTFDANGGNVETTSKIVYNGDAFGELPIPVLPNYNFKGWYTEINGGTLCENDTIVSTTEKEITLYAKWEVAPIAINDIPTITMTQEDAKEYYGKIVNNVNGYEFNPNSTDIRTWRVFYIDTENKFGDGKGTIYLKADDVASKVMRFSNTYEADNASGYASKFTTLSNSRYYKISGDSVVDSNQNVIDTLYLKLNPSYSTGRKT